VSESDLQEIVWTMEFKDIVVSHEWWRVLPDGTFQMYPGPLEASRDQGPMFTRCQVGSRAIAVFLGELVSESLNAQMISNRPDWLDAIVHANIASTDDITVAVIEASAAACTEVSPDACAFATACVVASDGTLDVEPDLYYVRIADVGSFEVVLEFDWDTEAWSGDVILIPDSELSRLA
jgi:hypothetical protein